MAQELKALLDKSRTAGYLTLEGGEIFNDYNNNQALSAYSVASGHNTLAGMLGYYYYDIDFSNNTITVTDKQGELPNETMPMNLSVGDVISLVNGSKFPDCSTITEINGNLITVDSLPFTSISATVPSDMDIDDNSIYVIAKPTIGIVQLGQYASASGVGTIALERASHAEGRDSQALGQYSHAEGRKTVALYAAHAEGYLSKALGMFGHAEGYNSKVSGSYGHAEGKDTVAATFAHAEGQYTIANAHLHTQGKFNKVDSEGKYAHILGNGTSHTNRSNAHTIDWDGNTWFAGNGTFDGKLTGAGAGSFNNNISITQTSWADNSTTAAYNVHTTNDFYLKTMTLYSANWVRNEELGRYEYSIDNIIRTAQGDVEVYLNPNYASLPLTKQLVEAWCSSGIIGDPTFNRLLCYNDTKPCNFPIILKIRRKAK